MVLLWPDEVDMRLARLKKFLIKPFFQTGSKTIIMLAEFSKACFVIKLYHSYGALISSCNRTKSSTITEEIKTSKFKARESKEPVGRVLSFAYYLRV